MAHLEDYGRSSDLLFHLGSWRMKRGNFRAAQTIPTNSKATRWRLANLCDSLAASMNLGYASYEIMGTGKSLR